MFTRRLNIELKFFDRELFAQRNEHTVQVFRRGTAWESFDFMGGRLHYSRPSPHYVFSLTHNWQANGRPVDWGIEPILGRLREIDNHNRDVLSDLWEENEKRELLRKREAHNERKAAAYDMRRDFARAVNDVNTSTLAKTDLRRKKENQIKCQS